jgi:hypothetical protein
MFGMPAQFVSRKYQPDGEGTHAPNMRLADFKTATNCRDLSSNNSEKNMDFKAVVRRIMVEAVRRVPYDESSRKKFLKQLFDV